MAYPVETDTMIPSDTHRPAIVGPGVHKQEVPDNADPPVGSPCVNDQGIAGTWQFNPDGWVCVVDPDDRKEAALRRIAADVGFREQPDKAGMFLLRRLDEVRAANADLVAALAPFADIGQWLFARDLPDDTPMIELQGLNHKGCLTRGDFKKAFSALALAKPTTGSR